MAVTDSMIALALRDYLQWVQLGASPEDKVFRRGVGLCFNVGSHIRNEQGYSSMTNTSVCHAMGQHFKAEGLDSRCPFGGERRYRDESYGDAHHLNLDRLEWARRFVAKHG